MRRTHTSGIRQEGRPVNRLRQWGLLAVIAAASFGLAFAFKSRGAGVSASATSAGPGADAPDSVQLSAMGIRPGRQLVVYVLVGARCGHCQRADTKAAIRTIRERVQQSSSASFRSAAVVGVAIDADLQEGLDYIQSVGLERFDEISVGNAWLNEHLVRLVWRERSAEPAVPQAVLVSRDMTARYRPFSVTYGSDSVMSVVSGRVALLEWVKAGAPVSPTKGAPQVSMPFPGYDTVIAEDARKGALARR